MRFGNFLGNIAARQLAHHAGHAHDRADDHVRQQHGEHADHGDDADDGGDGGGDAEFADGGIGHVAIHDDAEIPAFDRQVMHRNEVDQHRLAGQFGLAEAGADDRRLLGEDVAELLGEHGVVGVDEDHAVLVDQEGRADAAHVDIADHAEQAGEREIGAGDAGQLAVALHGRGDRKHQLAGGGIGIGIGDDRAARGDGILVPAAQARIVTLGHFGGRQAGERTVLLGAEIDHREFARHHRVVEAFEHRVVRRRLAGDVAGELGEHHAGIQPVGDAGRRQLS